MSCFIYIIQTSDYKFVSGDYISPVGHPEDFFNFEPCLRLSTWWGTVMGCLIPLRGEKNEVKWRN